MAFLAAIKKRTDLRAKGVAREADDRDPTTITDTPWIGELDPKRFASLPAGGKWMHFYDHTKIWPHWKKAQQLYRNGKLKGVSNMKVSTMHPHHAYGRGVIIFYCGPPEDEEKCQQIGRIILKETGYAVLSKKMFYKTDTQTLAKGKQGYHKWELPIPQENFEKLKLKQNVNDEKKVSAPVPPPQTAPKAPTAPMAAPMPQPKGPMAPMAPSPARPQPNLALLSAIEKKGNKKQKKRAKKKPNSSPQQPQKRPQPNLALLSAIEKKGKKKQQKNISTRVRTRDGKIYTETINSDGSVTKKLEGQEVIPRYLSENDAKSKTLPSYLFNTSTNRWVPVQHGDDDKKNDEEKNDDGKKVSELTIVSYNIWFANQQFEERQKKLLSMLEEINPDIFCLQEVTPRFMPAFCDNKYIQTNFELSDHKVGNTVVPYGVLIACNRKKNKLKMTDLQISHLYSNMGRRLLSACIGLDNDKKVWINTVHLESLSNTNVRIDQLRNIFNVYMKDQGESMLMGDFNFGENQTENNHLSKEYIDCWLEYKQTKLTLMRSRGGTCFGSRYDRILLRSKIWKPIQFDIVGKQNMPSDHLGIVTKLALK